MSDNRLEYIGEGRGVIVNILPSRISAKITKDDPYFFKDGDDLDDNAVKYYKSMEPMGIILVIEGETTKVDAEPTVEESKVEPIEEVTKEEVTSEPTEVEEVKKESVEIPEEVASEVTEAEIIEFLDLNYSDDDIRGLAKDAGVKGIKSSWSKSTVISKIISNNSEYVINLIKNS